MLNKELTNRLERIINLKDSITKAETELAALMQSNGDEPANKEAKEKTKRTYMHPIGLTATREKIRRAVIKCIETHNVVSPSFVRVHLNNNGIHINLQSVSMFLSHLRRDGLVEKLPTGLLRMTVRSSPPTEVIGSGLPGGFALRATNN